MALKSTYISLKKYVDGTTHKFTLKNFCNALSDWSGTDFYKVGLFGQSN